MKWFQHDCGARHDPQIRALGKKAGGEGLWIYFGLLETLGEHSETVHLKVLDIAPEADRAFEKLRRNPDGISSDLFDLSLDIKRIPRLSVAILAEDLLTTPETLKKTIRVAVALELFDRDKWRKYNVLYSPAFDRRADNYYRRRARRRESVRTSCEQSADTLRSSPENVPPEQNKTEEKEKKKQTRAAALHTMQTGCQQRAEEDRVVDPAPGDYDLYRRAFRRMIVSWNQTAEVKFTWMPGDDELERLFLGGDPRHKLKLCLEASRVSGKETHYCDLVLRALRELLKASKSSAIENPFGWLWTCLHGSGNGRGAWIETLKGAMP
jgi:hypothetical protein